MKNKEIKILKNGEISKVSLKNIDFDKLDYGNTNDIGIDSFGILQLPIFTGSWKRPKFSHNEYYLVEIINENYTKKTDYSTYSSTTHRFTIKIKQVINGREKQVGDVFWKRGKNLYPNYYEINRASQENLNNKHERSSNLKDELTSIY